MFSGTDRSAVGSTIRLQWRPPLPLPDGDLLLAAAGDDSDEEMQSVASNDGEELCVRLAGDDDDDSEDSKEIKLAREVPPVHWQSHSHKIYRRRLPSVVFGRRFPVRVELRR